MGSSELWRVAEARTVVGSPCTEVKRLSHGAVKLKSRLYWRLQDVVDDGDVRGLAKERYT